MRNRIIIIIIAAALLFLAGAGAYLIFVRGNTEPDPTVPEPVADLEPELSQELILAQDIVSPILSFDGQKIWYFTKTGQLFRVTISEKTTEEFVLPEQVANLTRVLWQDRGSNFLAEVLDLGHTRYKYYDAAAKSFLDHPDQMRNPVFVESTRKLAYDWVVAGGKHELKISDYNGENFATVAELFRSDYRLAASPAKNEIVLFNNDRNDPSGLLLVDLASGQFQPIGEKIPYEGVKFSPDGQKLLVEKAGLSQQTATSTLLLWDLTTRSSRALPFAASVDEVAWTAEGKEIIIGDDLKFITVTLATGLQQVLHVREGSEIFKITNLLLDPSAQTLFFQHAETGYLYKLQY